MDIKWKDGEGNILNADNKCIKYLDIKDNTKTVLKKEEIKKIVLEDGMMHIFRDFQDDLIITIIIPNGMNRKAVKIFNEFDRTGKMLKRKSNNFFLDLYLESSVATGQPLLGIAVLLLICSLMIFGLFWILNKIFGDVGYIIARILIIGYIAYSIVSYIVLRIKRRIRKQI